MFLRRLFDVLGGQEHRSQANVTVILPLFSVVDFPVVKAYPLVIAQELIPSNNAFRESYTLLEGRQSSAKRVAMVVSLSDVVVIKDTARQFFFILIFI